DADQNRSEWDFYTMTTDEIRAMLAKPLYISKNGNVLVMERLMPWHSSDASYDEREKQENVLNNATVQAYGFVIGDFHGGNWGIHKDKRTLLLDYASLAW